MPEATAGTRGTLVAKVSLSLRILGLPPKYSHLWWTPWSVFQDGPFRVIKPTTKVDYSTCEWMDSGTKRISKLKTPSTFTQHPQDEA